VIYNRYDVVKVPFPFTDKQASKTRPALVLSNQEFNDGIGHSVMAMITTAKNSTWLFDTLISDLNLAGLPAPSIVRMKLFTLDNSLIISKLGRLSERDQHKFEDNFKRLTIG
jgi:mRNA interferase MazF